MHSLQKHADSQKNVMYVIKADHLVYTGIEFVLIVSKSYFHRSIILMEF